jgi:hypothetical protein
MFAMDMTGENTAKTGGTFLIEKQADPSAVWPRPSDPHTEWGAGNVDERSLTGSLLNDLHLAVCLRRARDANWTVRTNPYEGGSDHTAFASAGIPSLLNWHFTDRYYHTNQDRLDKVSAGEMKNVAVAVATSAWLLGQRMAPMLRLSWISSRVQDLAGLRSSGSKEPHSLLRQPMLQQPTSPSSESERRGLSGMEKRSIVLSGCRSMDRAKRCAAASPRRRRRLPLNPDDVGRV